MCVFYSTLHPEIACDLMRLQCDHVWTCIARLCSEIKAWIQANVTWHHVKDVITKKGIEGKKKTFTSYMWKVNTWKWVGLHVGLWWAIKVGREGGRVGITWKDISWKSYVKNQMHGKNRDEMFRSLKNESYAGVKMMWKMCENNTTSKNPTWIVWLFTCEVHMTFLFVTLTQ